MTAQSARYDAQHALERPVLSLADAGRRIITVKEALRAAAPALEAAAREAYEQDREPKVGA